MAHDDVEQQRLQAVYADLSDDGLVELARKKGELTDVAQRAVDAAMAARGLAVDEEESVVAEAPDDPGADVELVDEESGLHRLCRFQFAPDVETATESLAEAGITTTVGRARGQMTEDGPVVDLPGLDLFVEPGERVKAEAVLRARMQLFPLAEEGSAAEEAEPLYVAGNFDTEQEAQSFVEALAHVGIRGSASEDEDDDGVFWTVEVAFADLEEALKVTLAMGNPQFPQGGTLV